MLLHTKHAKYKKKKKPKCVRYEMIRHKNIHIWNKVTKIKTPLTGTCEILVHESTQISYEPWFFNIVNLHIYIYIYIHTYICVCVHICIYIYTYCSFIFTNDSYIHGKEIFVSVFFISLLYIDLKSQCISLYLKENVLYWIKVPWKNLTLSWHDVMWWLVIGPEVGPYILESSWVQDTL